MVPATVGTGFGTETFEAVRRGSVPVGDLRRRAFEQFQAMPMPSPETEEWRYTDLREFDLDAFEPYRAEPAAPEPGRVQPGVRDAVGEVGRRAGLAIQHNSTMVSAHLDDDAVGRGVVFCSLDEAEARLPDLVAEHLHRAVPVDRTRFTALHAAFRRGGSFVHVPRDVRVEFPLQAITYVDRDGLAVFPHTLIVLEEGAELTFIDRYLSRDLTRVFSNAVVEIHAGPNARLRYVTLQDWGRGVTHLGVQRAVVDRDAEVRSLAVAFGADLSRMEAETLLVGDGGASEMLGVYFGGREQHFDFRSIQDHAGSRTSSDLLYKGALRARARSVYSGTVVIQAGAHACDAYQTNRNILLSETAKADSVPNLEILCNDPVRCGHAASVGPVDEETIFYMQSRGISEAEAQRLIVTGFFQEVLDRVTIPEIKEGLEATIADQIARVDGGEG